MTCELYLEMISASLDGELTDAEAREMDAHLQDCPECSELLELMKLQAGRIAEHVLQPMPESLCSSIKQNLRFKSAKPLIPSWSAGDPLRMPAVSTKTNRQLDFVMGPWGRTQ